MIRFTHTGALVRAFPGEDRHFRAVYSSYYAYCGPSAFPLGDPDWAPQRTAWAGAAPAVTYHHVPGAESWAETTAATVLPVTNPAAPLPVVPGDGVYSNLFAEAIAGATGTAEHRATWHHADGSTTVEVLATFDTAGTYTYPDPWALPVPATAVGLSLDIQTTGAGFRLWDATVGLESMDAEHSAVTIRRGRATGSATTPSTATVTGHLAGYPAITVGEDVQVHLDVTEGLGLDPGELAWENGYRFVGTVSDASAVIAPGGPNQLPVIAVSPIARLGDATIGDEPWPAESALERAARILDLAASQNVDIEIHLPAGAGGLTVAARDVDAQPATGLLDELAADTGLLVQETRQGALTALLPPARDTTVKVTLTPAHFARPMTLTQTPVAGDTVAVEWGPTDDRQTLTLRTGLPSGNVRRLEPHRTTLGDRDAALVVAARDLAEAVAQVWRVEALTVDLLRLLERDGPGDLEVVTALVTLERGDLIQLDGLTADVPRMAGGGLVVVDGWTETITKGSWRFQLDVVDAPQRLALATWDDVAADTRTWADLDPTITWAATPAYL